MIRNLRLPAVFAAAVVLSGCDFFETILGLESCDDRTLIEVLAEDNLRRDKRCDDGFEEYLLGSALTQADAALGEGLIRDIRWSNWILALRRGAGISSLTTIDVATDFRTTWTDISGYGGGVTGHNRILLDGKFLDILQDIASYVSLVEAGLVQNDYFAAADAIVARHMSGLGPVPLVYNHTSFPAEVRDRAEVHFSGLAGAILYHEFGHSFLAHMQEQFSQSYRIFVRTDDNEDESDEVAGALSKKAGHELDDVWEMYDLMAFYSMNKLPFFGFTTLAQVKQDMRIQFGESDPRYSSLAVRKEIATAAYNAFPGPAASGLSLSKVPSGDMGLPHLPDPVTEWPEGLTPTPVPEHIRWDGGERS